MKSMYWSNFFMHRLFAWLVILVPCLTVSYWYFFEWFHVYGFQVVTFPIESMTINTKTKLLGCIVGFVPVMVLCYGFFQLSKLFLQYSKGFIFSPENVLIYKKLGLTLYFYAFADNIFDMLISWVVSFQNTSGSHFFYFGVNSTQLICLLSGLVVFKVAQVMHQGHQLECETQLTI